MRCHLFSLTSLVFCFNVLTAISFCAGEEPKAPAEVESALQERVQKFYQAHVDGKFRLADAFVAEDSKDYFYGIEKPRYRSFESSKLSFSDNFSKAKVQTRVETEWRHPRLGSMIVHPIVASSWKLENGLWCWYNDSQSAVETPFGLQKRNTATESPLASIPGYHKVTPEELAGSVSIDKSEVSLSSYQASSDQVLVKNDMPGAVDIQFDLASQPGLAISLDKTSLKSGEVARITFKYDPPNKAPKPTVTGQLAVAQTGRTTPIRLVFAVPADLLRGVPEALKKGAQP